MGFEQFKLDRHNVFGLYPNSLVLVAESGAATKAIPNNGAQAETAKVETSVIAYTGGNKRRVTIAIAGSFTEQEWDIYNSTLLKMLGALKMTMEDVAVIRTDSNDIDYKDVKKELNALFIIVFETNDHYIKLPIRNNHFEELLFDGVTFLIAPLMALSPNRADPAILAVKNKLWVSLQRIFPIGK